MSLDLDDLIEDVTPEPVETVAEPSVTHGTLDPMVQPKEFVTRTVVVGAPTSEDFLELGEFPVMLEPAPVFVTSMVVHNQHLYIATASGRVFRSELRFRDDRNKWDEIKLPEEM